MLTDTRIHCTLAAFALLICSIGAVADGTPPIRVIGQAQSVPVIDGNLDDPVWQDAVQIGPLIKFNSLGQSQAIVKPHCVARLLYDQKNIFVMAEMQEPAPNKLTIKNRPPGRQVTGAELWTDDHVELFVGIVGKPESRLQIMVNPHNCRVAVLGSRSFIPSGRSATRISDGNWTVELEIPGELLDVDLAQAPALRFNFYRVRRVQGAELSCWTPVEKRFADWDRFGYLILGSFSENIRSLREQMAGSPTAIRLDEIQHILADSNIGGEYQYRYDELAEIPRRLERLNPPVTGEIWLEIADAVVACRIETRKLWEELKLWEIVENRKND